MTVEERAARRFVNQALLSSVCRELTPFGLTALYLACRHQHGDGRIPDIIARSLSEGQVRLVSGLLADDEGRQDITIAVESEMDVRTWGTHH